MTKQEAINLFKFWVKSNETQEERISAVKTQFNRRAWGLSTEEGYLEIRISKVPKIRVWFKKLINKPEVEFTLLLNEYKELERLYFGNIKPDYKYLIKLSKNVGN